MPEEKQQTLARSITEGALNRLSPKENLNTVGNPLTGGGTPEVEVGQSPSTQIQDLIKMREEQFNNRAQNTRDQLHAEGKISLNSEMLDIAITAAEFGLPFLVPGGAALKARAGAQAGISAVTAFARSMNEEGEAAIAVEAGMERGAAAAALEAGMSLATRGLYKGGSLARKGFNNSVEHIKTRVLSRRAAAAGKTDGLARGTNEIVNDAKEFGVTISPGLLSSEWLATTSQKVAEGSIFPNRVKTMMFESGEKLQQHVRDAINTSTPLSGYDISQAMMAFTRGHVSHFSGVARGFYREFDSLTQGATMSMSKIKRQAQLRLDEQITRGPGDQNEMLMEFYRNVMSKTDDLPYPSAHKFRSDWFAESTPTGLTSRQEKELMKAKKDFAKLMGSEMDAGLEGMNMVGAVARETYKRAGKIWKDEVAGVFDSDILQKFANDSPESVLDVLMSAKTQSEVEKAHRVITSGEGGADVWMDLQGRVIKRILLAAKTQGSTRIAKGGMTSGADDLVGSEFETTGAALMEQIDSLRGLDSGENLLAGMFPGGDMKQIDNLRRIANLMNANTGALGTGSNQGLTFALVNLSAAGGAATSVATIAANDGETSKTEVAMVIGGFAVALAPNMLGRVLANPKTVEWMLAGIGSSPGSRLAKRAGMGALLSMLNLGVIAPPDQERVATWIKEQSGSDPDMPKISEVVPQPEESGKLQISQAEMMLIQRRIQANKNR